MKFKLELVELENYLLLNILILSRIFLPWQKHWRMGFLQVRCSLRINMPVIFQQGKHGSTFGGNPLAMASANEVLKEIDSDFLEKVD